jgi:hypothetical protein
MFFPIRKKCKISLLILIYQFTVKHVYNELGYNEFPLITNHIVRTDHRSHGLLYKMIGYNELVYNENLLLTNEFSKTDSINSIRL